LGFIIYGALSIYIVFIFMRIVFSWGMVSHSNRLMRFLGECDWSCATAATNHSTAWSHGHLTDICFSDYLAFPNGDQGTLLRGGLPPAV
jgi:hypothetical protein